MSIIGAILGMTLTMLGLIVFLYIAFCLIFPLYLGCIFWIFLPSEREDAKEIIKDTLEGWMLFLSLIPRFFYFSIPAYLCITWYDFTNLFRKQKKEYPWQP